MNLSDNKTHTKKTKKKKKKKNSLKQGGASNGQQQRCSEVRLKAAAKGGESVSAEAAATVRPRINRARDPNDDDDAEAKGRERERERSSKRARESADSFWLLERSWDWWFKFRNVGGFDNVVQPFFLAIII
jgi:hypothetical protein